MSRKQVLGLKLVAWLALHLLGDAADDEIRHLLKVRLSMDTVRLKGEGDE